MANELKISASATLTNGKHKETFNPGALSITQAAQGAHAPVVIVGTSEEVIDDGDVTTLGWLFLHNLDSANYVTIGPEDTGAMVAFMRIEAGEIAILRLEPGITIRAQANTAPVKIKMLLLQD